jgi:predicted GH43/DUF377 family glycosyl hydrolase
MKWRKLGLVFRPDSRVPWMKSHAAMPLAEPVDGHVVRVYFSSRDAAQRAHTGWVELDLRRPAVPLRRAGEPILAPGAAGFFDDSGAMLTCLTPVNGETYLYYIGWNLGRSVPFRNSLGLAVRDASGNVRRYANGPILDRGPHDPCFVANACVRREGSQWRMWYLSCVEWQLRGDRLRHRYHIKHALSSDGIHWERDGTTCIDFRDDSEYAISCPCVHHEGGQYRMWYSYRGAAYRIGYAVSSDGLRWQRRDDEVGIDVSPAGWDATMIEYPNVFDQAGSRYMLYNGDDYGREGFGLAVLEQD